MLALYLMLSEAYYAQNYAGIYIIGLGLSVDSYVTSSYCMTIILASLLILC